MNAALRVLSVGLVLCSGVAACGPKDASAEEQDVPKAAAGQAPRTPAPDMEVLRRVADYQQGLIALAEQAGARGSPGTRAEASAVLERERAEQAETLRLLRQLSGGAYQPASPSTDRSAAETLRTTAVAEFEKLFRMGMVVHHREVVGVIGGLEPKLTRPEVRALVQRLRTRQLRESDDIEARMVHR